MEFLQKMKNNLCKNRRIYYISITSKLDFFNPKNSILKVL